MIYQQLTIKVKKEAQKKRMNMKNFLEIIGKIAIFVVILPILLPIYVFYTILIVFFLIPFLIFYSIMLIKSYHKR
ncbi:hypothetical protein D5R40_11970 [Okeania hirsuta]|uniref:Uncharacterized protein n=1 Tax=Okeania hirsuta TaxID=1458930 RepID=A0A3N6P791_9CYAN|nr:hypothetical protein [Okeania sp. SIO1F9]NET75582.1 hypothetical protein [Okeania sp. SIO1F9]RQH18925.1 hypothetical protein D4Z78_14685 [Okeania hirsuta]RQH44029.1 hypothetical protein D5R40_11970 [Okeania hirsuta]